MPDDPSETRPEWRGNDDPLESALFEIKRKSGIDDDSDIEGAVIAPDACPP